MPWPPAPWVDGSRPLGIEAAAFSVARLGRRLGREGRRRDRVRGSGGPDERLREGGTTGAARRGSLEGSEPPPKRPRTAADDQGQTAAPAEARSTTLLRGGINGGVIIQGKGLRCDARTRSPPPRPRPGDPEGQRVRGLPQRLAAPVLLAQGGQEYPLGVRGMWRFRLDLNNSFKTPHPYQL